MDCKLLRCSSICSNRSSSAQTQACSIEHDASKDWTVRMHNSAIPATNQSALGLVWDQLDLECRPCILHYTHKLLACILQNQRLSGRPYACSFALAPLKTGTNQAIHH
eukprot:4951803-Amphidinium_carterae.1